MKLNTISRALINSYISHDEFALVNVLIMNNVLRKYNDMKEEIKYLKTSIVHQRF